MPTSAFQLRSHILLGILLFYSEYQPRQTAMGVCFKCPQSTCYIVDIYDSIPLYSQQSTPLQKQVATVIKTADPKFKLVFVDIQRQLGSSDCELFAIAFCYESLSWP